MRRVLAVAGLLVAAVGSPARAEDVCVKVVVTGVISHTEDHCIPSPFVTHTIHQETGLQPYIYVEIDLTVP
jgi:hypothetical protein